MIYKNKKFYDENGEVVPLEFGNKQQLALIEKAKALETGIFSIGQFLCLCGELTKGVFRDEHVFACPGCQQKYQYFFDDEIPCIKSIK